MLTCFAKQGYVKFPPRLSHLIFFGDGSENGLLPSHPGHVNVFVWRPERQLVINPVCSKLHR